MTKDGDQFDPKERTEELLRRFADDPDSARREIAILPYYHSIENAITRPNQGTWVTRYFRLKWRPALGKEVADLVEAIRFCADKKTGETIASMETIAEVAGLSKRSVERLLSSTPPKGRSDDWLERWRLLHEFFIVGKKGRYRQKTIGGRSQVHRTTNRLIVAMDDPVHPDDYDKFYAEAASRIAAEEAKKLQSKEISYNRPAGGYREHEVVRDDPDSPEVVDNSAYDRPVGGHIAPTDGRGLSLFDRSTNVDNVDQNPAKRARVFDLSPEERQARDERAYDILRELYKAAGYREDPPEDHKNMGYYRRIATLLDPSQVYQAVAATRDAALDGRANDVFRYFHGAALNIARDAGVDLGLKSGSESAARAK
jgi:hypothetical protein